MLDNSNAGILPSTESAALTFSLYPLRFRFRALDPVLLPEGKAGNVFRGAFGLVFRRTACRPPCDQPKQCARGRSCPYARMFEPALEHGPSGLANPPRPFVLRATHLDGALIAKGDHFEIDVHLFNVKDPGLVHFIRAFCELAKEGIGPKRGRVELVSVTSLDSDRAATQTVFDGARSLGHPATPSKLVLPLHQPLDRTEVLVWFLTPTELKSGGELVSTIEFHVLFARIRDRISTLSSLYGSGPLHIDFRGMAERARSIRVVETKLQYQKTLRRSSRTGESHPISGFFGEVAYEGEIGEFIPFLRAAYWTGVGRQTVWGNGVIRIDGEFSESPPECPIDP